MTTLLFILEEPSARALLESFLPRILPGSIEVQYAVFEGKQDLQKRLEKRLREWQKPETRFIVVHDQDSADCLVLKQTLQQHCNQSEKASQTIIRIPCHELESWYLGDLHAVEQALGLKGLEKKQSQEKYRTPDHLTNASEELKKLAKGRYQKIAGSREIGKHLSPEQNQSHSFHVFLQGLDSTVSLLNR